MLEGKGVWGIQEGIFFWLWYGFMVVDGWLVCMKQY